MIENLPRRYGLDLFKGFRQSQIRHPANGQPEEDVEMQNFSFGERYECTYIYILLIALRRFPLKNVCEESAKTIQSKNNVALLQMFLLATEHESIYPHENINRHSFIL